MMNDSLNIEILPDKFAGTYDMPVVRTDVPILADSLIPFNAAKTYTDKNVGVHFFIDDYQFERVWRSPQRYIEMLGKYKFVCAPDFSLYLDMPMAAQIWNVYRSRLITAYWQKNGVKVVPVLQWAGPNSWKFCFDGITHGGIVAVSTWGAARNKLTKQIWKAGMSEAIQRLRPVAILLYGRLIDFDFGDIQVVHYTNEVQERRSDYGR